MLPHDDDECYGCKHHDLHRPLAPGEPCYDYCRSCEIRLGANCEEYQADWYLWRLQEICNVNPSLLNDFMHGRMTFDQANDEAIAVDKQVQ